MPDWIARARIETFLMREFLAEEGERPELEECVWVVNAPLGPSRAGMIILWTAQDWFGFENVTTGNASEGATGQVCGIYVRKTSYEETQKRLMRRLEDG